MSDDNSVQKILAAALFAAQKHAQQRRKGINAEPYVNHLIEVAQLVSMAAAPVETDVVVAALLHDTVEDVGVKYEDLVERFGTAAADMVMEVTDDKKLPKPERKRLQVLHAAEKSRGAGLIKLADKTSNLRAIKASPPTDWSAERKLAYVAWASEVVGGLRSPDPGLLVEFEKARLELLQG